MSETNLSAAPEQSAPAAAPEAAAPHEATEETVTVGALRGAIERRNAQRARRAAEEAAVRWSREADELTAQYPDFDLSAALKDTQFCALLRAGADGHADFCPGRDIVCAGASALVCALAGALDQLGAQGVQRTLCAGHAAIAADDRADVRAAFTVAVTGLRQLAAAYPGHVAEDTGRVPAQETETHGSVAAGRCPGAVPGSGQQRKKET